MLRKPGLQTWQVLTAIGVGSFLGVVVVCGGGLAMTGWFIQQQLSWAAGLGTSYSGGSGFSAGVPDLRYDMNLPARVQQGVPFEVELTLENTGTTPMTLHSVYDYSGLSLMASDPPWSQYSHDEAVYGMTIDPGQTRTVKITAISHALGSQSINFDAYMDASGTRFAEAYGNLIVDPPPPPPPPSASPDG
ncbi:MAG: hypothetical protein AAFX76_04195 [Planctomycetota bacterium]